MPKRIERIGLKWAAVMTTTIPPEAAVVSAPSSWVGTVKTPNRAGASAILLPIAASPERSLHLRGDALYTCVVLMRTALWGRLAVLAFAGFGLAAVVRNPDPADNLARVRLVVTTTAASAAISV